MQAADADHSIDRRRFHLSPFIGMKRDADRLHARRAMRIARIQQFGT